MRGKGKNNKWTLSNAALEALKYERRSDFQKECVSGYRLVRKAGLLSLIFGEKKTGNVEKWTVDAIRKEASLYTNRVDFYRGSGGAYNAAKEKGMIDELFGFTRNQWTIIKLVQEASRHKTKSEFAKANSSAYNTFLKLDKQLMDCLFTEDRTPTDNDVIYIWKATGQYFDGNPVYKIGVTSLRLGMQRIIQVANASGFTPDLICMREVDGKASELERKIHHLGTNPMFDGFNGKTEFRSLSDAALGEALSIISGAA